MSSPDTRVPFSCRIIAIQERYAPGYGLSQWPTAINVVLITTLLCVAIVVKTEETPIFRVGDLITDDTAQKGPAWECYIPQGHPVVLFQSRGSLLCSESSSLRAIRSVVSVTYSYRKFGVICKLLANLVFLVHVF